MSGSLVLVATPLGNLDDLSPRARAAMEAAEAWLVEDTRVAAKLGQLTGIKRPLKRLDEHSRDEQLLRYVSELEAGANFALMSDAGVPGISDPGARMVDLAREADIPVDCIPGPSAVTTALALSGFYAQRFVFLGFLGRKRGDIIKELAPFADSTLTLVLFESPFRVDSVLEAAHAALGTRRYAITRELTKLHQQVVRGDLPELPSEKEMPRKGEFTLVLEGKRREKAVLPLSG